MRLENTARLDGPEEPYRLYNLDQCNDTWRNQSLYGNVPLIFANDPKHPYSAGMMWANASNTFVRVSTNRDVGDTRDVHFISETGVLECFTFLGNSPYDISSAYQRVTGTTPLPQFFALGYHQCRWDFDTQVDILQNSTKFDEARIPCDCMWLDIEHTQEKRYFTWDHATFPTPLDMIARLHQQGRKLVVIVDPHIKADPDFPLYKRALEESSLQFHHHRHPDP